MKASLSLSLSLSLFQSPSNFLWGGCAAPRNEILYEWQLGEQLAIGNLRTEGCARGEAHKRTG